jgi:hypothetical protein
MAITFVKEGKKNVIAGLACMIIFFLFGMLMGFLSESESKELPSFVQFFLGFFMEEDLFPSLTKFEWHLKYAHVHGEGLGVFCTFYGFALNWCSRQLTIRITSVLVIAGTFMVPLSFTLSMINPTLIYGITVGSIIITGAFIFFIYDLLYPLSSPNQ